jgi:hypothetical protein
MKWFVGTLLLLAAGLVFEWGLQVYATYVLLGVLLASRALTAVSTPRGRRSVNQ